MQTHIEDESPEGNGPRWRRWLDSFVRKMANAGQAWSLYDDVGMIYPDATEQVCETGRESDARSPSKRLPGNSHGTRLVR